MPHPLMEQLGRTVLTGSGALGTSLRKAVDLPGAPVEWLNIGRPEAVRAIHEAYRAARSQILVTNTFAANPRALQEAGLAASCRVINEAGVGIARAAAAGDLLVWASVGPLSLGLTRDDYTDDQLLAIYAEQCQALTGADAILLETFTCSHSRCFTRTISAVCRKASRPRAFASSPASCR